MSEPISNPNAYIDARPWGKVVIDGFTVPGIVQSIGGCNTPEEWDVQKGTSGNFGTTVWKGGKLAESIEIVTKLVDVAQFGLYYSLRDKLRPKRGTKPPSLSITNPRVNFNGITRIAVKDIEPPEWIEAGGYWTGKVTLLEYNPSKKANAGPAGAAKTANTPPDPMTAELEKLLATANSL